MTDTGKYRVKPGDLAKKCNLSGLKFQTTADLKPLKGVIGQERAASAVALGLDIENSGYNIYLSGYLGTGKTTMALELVQQKASKKPIPPDWCYVYNFQNPDHPSLLQFEPGEGKVFQKDITSTVDQTIKSIVKAFESEEFEEHKNELLNTFVEYTNNRYLKLEEEAREMGFSVSRNQNGITSVPVKNGEPLSQEDYVNMSEAEKTELMAKNRMVQEKLTEAFRQYKEMEKETREKVKNLERETASAVANSYFTDLLDKYRTSEETVISYLEALQQDILEHTDIFTESEEQSVLAVFRSRDKKAFLRRYQVNLIVDNSALKHAPVIIESNPTFANLFGQIEYEGEFGVLATDFSKIKPGAIQRANGGYLILHMYDVAKNFYIWDTLKRVLKTKKVVVESIGKNLGLSNTETMEPEAMPLSLKVILIGEPFYYYLLYHQDEEFQKLFKVKADFDIEMERNPKHIKDYARLIASVCNSNNLRHFDRLAVARIIEYGSRMAEDQNKLTTLFNKLVEIIYEADCWAGYEEAEAVSRKHVNQAIMEKRNRSALLEEKIQESIDRNTLIINVDGEKIGELNGLAVYQMGDMEFGKPVRITAKTFMGEKGLVNIEREIRMSGSIHSKGVLTLNGYMGAQYAQDKPLGLSASLTFEQSYQGIEGDSASSAELYALLSSLADVPIRQGIAVTGSVNQNGEIQPVGGVNQKIEGFYEVCRKRGLNGEQGVIIPRQNIADLMLNDEIIEAVKAKKFTVWAVNHINEGIEILTSLPAGVRDERGNFPCDTLNYLVDQKLREWNERRREAGVENRRGIYLQGRKRRGRF